ncbi:hypothetical protein [Cerasicoccus maritimus]|uniref:hypothetical protein n=1 Tax=Cerasicoccus maritimus TaxID=490089 RepID=UPI002852727D|nr:hypothetical protein [Cerasicoccus maritimus]
MTKHLPLTLTSVFLFCLRIHAEILLSGFGEYANGSLTEQFSPEGQEWTRTGSIEAFPLIVNYGEVPLMGDGEDATIGLGGIHSNTTIYVGLTLSLINASDGTGDFFAALGGDGTTYTAGRLYASTNGATAGGFRLGGSTSYAGGANFGTTDLYFNTPYRIVLAYTADSATPGFKIYVNPISPNEEDNTVYISYFRNYVSGLNEVASFQLSQFGGQKAGTISDLLVATTFAEAFAATSPTTPLFNPILEDNFENAYTGSIGGQKQWDVLAGNAIVQNTVTHEGLKALDIGETTLAHDILRTNDLLWLRVYVKMNAPPTSTPIVLNSTSLAFYVDTDRHLVALDGQTPIDTSALMPLNSWVQFDVFCDYENMHWNLSMNGTTIGEAMALYSANTNIQHIVISNSSNQSAYIDEILITDYEQPLGAPDIDSDGLPDWWELTYFGEIEVSEASAQSFIPNLSNRDAYVSGVNPNRFEPIITSYSHQGTLRWNTKPYRTYEVQWTPDLNQSFMTIETLSWPNSKFIETDAYRLAQPVSFYRLNVKLNDN